MTAFRDPMAWFAVALAAVTVAGFAATFVVLVVAAVTA